MSHTVVTMQNKEESIGFEASIVLPQKRIIAIIPARAGSKRLPGKNTKDLCGKPLFEWSIEAALQCSSISKTLVSTDCQDTAALAKSMGADAPFIRPADLAGDTVASIDVVLHALTYLENNGQEFDYVILLQPTSPLRTTQDISQAINQLNEQQAAAIISVCECEHSPLWTNTLDHHGDMTNFLVGGSENNTRSQDLPTYYRLNGAIYIANVSALREQKNFFLTERVFAYTMAQQHSIDIDSAIDFKLAELLLSERLTAELAS